MITTTLFKRFGRISLLVASCAILAGCPDTYSHEDLAKNLDKHYYSYLFFADECITHPKFRWFRTDMSPADSDPYSKLDETDNAVADVVVLKLEDVGVKAILCDRNGGSKDNPIQDIGIIFDGTNADIRYFPPLGEGPETEKHTLTLDRLTPLDHPHWYVYDDRPKDQN